MHLIKDSEVDIHEISIAEIAEQYLEYVNMMELLNLDIAGEYLVMASTLTYLKSKTLLPQHEQEDEEGEDGVDPRDDLIAKLVEYKKYKEAAMDLKGMELNQSQVYSRNPAADDLPDDADLLLEVDVLELLKSFKTVLDRYGGVKELNVTLEEISVTDKISEIMAMLEPEEYLTFDALFAEGKGKMEVIATFLALLELIRLKLLRVNQTRIGGEILIYKSEEPEMDVNPEDTTSEGDDGS